MRSRIRLLLLPSVVAVLVALLLSLSGQAPRFGPTATALGFAILVARLPRESAFRGELAGPEAPPASGMVGAFSAFAGGVGSGVLLLAAYRFLLHAGLQEGPSAALVLVVAGLPPAIDLHRDRGGGLLFIPLMLLVEPGIALILPRGLAALRDPLHLLVTSLGAGITLAAATGMVLLRAGGRPPATAAGLLGGFAVGLLALVTGEWHDAVVLALAACGLAGSLALFEPARDRTALAAAAKVMAPGALGVVILRLALPWIHGLAPGPYDARSSQIHRFHGLDETIVGATANLRTAAAITGSQGTFLMLPGDLDVFTAGPLILAYRPLARTALLVGATTKADAEILAASGCFDKVVTALPSPFPAGSPLLDRGRPLPTGERYDAIVVNVSSRGVASVLDRLDDLLSPGGLVVMRRFGDASEESPEALRFARIFPQRRVYWDSERTSLSLLSREPLAASPSGVGIACTTVAERLPLLGLAGLRLRGAWLEPQEGGNARKSAAVRGELAMVHLATGNPFDANNALGSERTDSPPFETALRALIQAAMGDPTEEGRPRRLAAAAMAAEPGNPYFRRIADMVGLPSGREPAPSCDPLVFGQVYDEVPSWLVAGPFPIPRFPRLGLLAPDLLADRLVPSTTEEEARPALGDDVYTDVRTRTSWRLSGLEIRADALRNTVPFALAVPPEHGASCAYAYSEIDLDASHLLEVRADRITLLWIDGRRYVVAGRAGTVLDPGVHRLLVKGYALAGHAPEVTVALHPLGAGAPGAPRGVRSIVRTGPEAQDVAAILDGTFHASISRGRSRDRTGRLLTVELPPFDEALGSLEVDVPVGPAPKDRMETIALCPGEKAQALGLGNPGRHHFVIGDVPARTRLRVRATAGGRTVTRDILVPERREIEIAVVPTTYEPAPTAESQRLAISASLETLRRTGGSIGGLRFRTMVPWSESAEQFLRGASAEEAEELRAALAAGDVELGALAAPSDRRLSTPQIEVEELQAVRSRASQLGVVPRAVVADGTGGLPVGLGEILAASGIRLVLAAGSQAKEPWLQGDPGGSAVPLVVAVQPDPAYGRELLLDGPSHVLAAVDALADLGPGPLVLHAAVPGAREPELLVQSVARFRRQFESPRIRIATPTSLLASVPPPGSLPTCCRSEDRSLPGVDRPMQLAVARASVARRSSRRLFVHAASSLRAAVGSAGAPAGDGGADDLEEVARAIGRRLPAGGPYRVVVNPLPHARLEPVAGEGELPVVMDVPAMGYRAVDTTQPAAARGSAEVDPERGVLRNRSFEVRIDADGRIAAITAREAGFPIVERGGTSFLSVEESAGGVTRLLPFRGPPLLEGDASARVAKIPIGQPDGPGSRGQLVLTFHAGVERLDVRLELDPTLVAPLARASLLVDSDLPAPALVVEEAFSSVTVADQAPHVMRGGFTLRSSRGIVAFASPDAAIVARQPGAAGRWRAGILLYEASAAGLPPEPLVYRFGVAAHPSLQDAWSPFAFFRTFELPMMAVMASPPASAEPAERPLPLQRSLLRLEPGETELILRTVPAADDTRLDLLVRNASDRERKQKIVFPDQESYLIFPIGAGELLKLQIERP